ncbi:outer membrane murein-binding lipoprotein Lpp [Cupriavidus metallidurans]|uniref:hypothetical protein n=1 Tax=Cupriavidus metallidurans TaxID=119219 RepID=UPI000A7EB8AE|nr:hypothetical protein [Cupriavidus metallidurans]MDE4918378.1 hypothetical protein [Cupriavidus metallidurans]
MDIIDRLESHNAYCEDCDSRQLRKDAAARIRELEHQVSELENQVRRARSDKMSRRSA